MERTISDAALVFAVQQEGDKAAFEALYIKYLNRIYPLALRMSGNIHRAEDLTHDVFLHLWKKIKLFNSKSNFFTWFYRLAINFFINTEKKEKRRMFREGIEVDSNSTVHRDLCLDTKIDLERAITTLPPKARMVLILHDINKMTHAEIGRYMYISPGSSKSQLHRARFLLREVLSK